MAEKISQYTADATSDPIKVDDYLDFSNSPDLGITWDVSKKIKVSEFTTYLNGIIDNLYNVDGTLAGNRTITAGGLWTKFVHGDVIIQPDEAVNFGFLVYNIPGSEIARFGFDQPTASGMLSISSNGGEFWKVINDFVEFHGSTLLTYNLANDRVIFGEGFDDIILQPDNNGFVGVSTFVDVDNYGPVKMNVNGVLRTEGRLNVKNISTVTWSGTTAIYQSAATGQDAKFQTFNAADEVTVGRGVSPVMRGTTAGTIFGDVGFAATDAFQFYAEGFATGRMQLIGSTTNVGNQIRNVELDLNSQYWDGALTQQKNAKINHNITAAPSGDSQLEISIGGTTLATFDESSTAGDTRFLIYDVDNATLERVTVGAADSGGVGFKLLRIPN